MATILYLDVDDEITTAATRMRGAADKTVAIVLPAGSRLATSRINFRLLAREGLERNRTLSIVAADPAARAIAASAGLPVYASVADFEAEAAPGAAAGEPRSTVEQTPTPAAGPSPTTKSTRRRQRAAKETAAGAGAVGGSAVAGESVVSRAAAGQITAEQMSADLLAGRGSDAPTIVAPPPLPRPGPPAETRPLSPPETRPRSSAATSPIVPTAWSGGLLSGRLLAVLGSLLIVLLILAVVGYVVLPQATVVVTPVAAPIGPVSFVVRADPDATTVDATGGVIPATRLSLDFTASGEYPATGKRVVQAKAKGALRWRNCDPTRSYTIPAGTIASTGSGIGFATDAAVFLPVAISSPDGTKITCQPRVVAARAVKAGPSGNVGAGSVTVVPSNLNSVVIKVTNPGAMTGGKRDEFTRVQQSDIDAALAQLTRDIGAQFTSWEAAPDALPQGATAFAATGKLGSVVPSVDPSTLIDLEQPTFQLAATSTGTVVAVDTSQIARIAQERIAAQVPAERTLRDGSVTAQHDTGSADGELVDFRVTAAGQAIPVLDPNALREAIKGRSVDEARSILGRYGTVRIDTWPGFVSSIPTLDARLDLTVAGDGAPSSPAPSGAAPSSAAP
ncbi:MAG: baseplate J/gp47 family protein [Chloroflexota bacterium]|nr:baseplate J/gp47 family protein [Chloroflexota bacterium]